ncbi:MAG: MoaD/ThiS family protein [Gammaproteobacteria bacterium]
MKITLKLFSSLMEYLPDDADGNALEVHARAPLTPRMLIEKYRVPAAEARVVMVNGEFLPPDMRESPLQDGDVMSVWPSIQGG